MVIEIDVSWSSSVVGHELLIAFRSLVLGVSGQHALETHAYAFHILYGCPALRAEEIETDDSVGVNMWVHRNWAVFYIYECNFRWFCICQDWFQDEVGNRGVVQV